MWQSRCWSSYSLLVKADLWVLAPRLPSNTTPTTHPANTQRNKHVIITSKCVYYVVCLLGNIYFNQYAYFVISKRTARYREILIYSLLFKATGIVITVTPYIACKVPGILDACSIRNFTYLVRGPLLGQSHFCHHRGSLNIWLHVSGWNIHRLSFHSSKSIWQGSWWMYHGCQNGRLLVKRLFSIPEGNLLLCKREIICHSQTENLYISICNPETNHITISRLVKSAIIVKVLI